MIRRVGDCGGRCIRGCGRIFSSSTKRSYSLRSTTRLSSASTCTARFFPLRALRTSRISSSRAPSMPASPTVAKAQYPASRRRSRAKMVACAFAGALRGTPSGYFRSGSKNWRCSPALRRGGNAALEARLPALHARPLVSVLEKFALQPRRLGDLKGEYFSTVMWMKPMPRRTALSAARPASRRSPVNGSSPAPLLRRQSVLQDPAQRLQEQQGLRRPRPRDTPRRYLPRTNYVPPARRTNTACSHADSPLE
jgi:hypothetical protein